MNEEFGSDADFAALAQAAERAPAPPSVPSVPSAPGKVTQPTPRALPARSGPSAIQVSTRQRGNPVLTHISALPWEYADIEPDYVLGATACALYLSLKYHRLHPEYVYTRMRALGRRYRLRVLLVTVDADNHEEPLRELAKTALVNGLTLVLSWSAREAARYLEAYRALEHAAPAAIRGAAAAGWGERARGFVSAPRGVNRADVAGLLGAFGSLRAAVNAPAEDVAGVQGWGEVKVRRWRAAVAEPFRGAGQAHRQGDRRTAAFVSAAAVGRAERERLARSQPAAGGADGAERVHPPEEDEGGLLDVERPQAADAETPDLEHPPKRPRRDEPEMDAGVAAALAKYRQE